MPTSKQAKQFGSLKSEIDSLKQTNKKKRINNLKYEIFRRQHMRRNMNYDFCKQI